MFDITLREQANLIQGTFLNERTIKQLERLSAYQLSENTLNGYIKDLWYIKSWILADTGRVFVDMTDAERIQPFEVGLPLPLDLVVKFVIDHLDGLDEETERKLCATVVIDGKPCRIKDKPGPHSINTVKRRISALSQIHAAKGITKDENPCLHPQVKKVFQAKQRENTRNRVKDHRKAPIPGNLLLDMLEHCGDDLAGIRDRALLSFAFASGGRRRSEISEAMIEDLSPAPDGGYIYYMPFSKTDQTGEGDTFPIMDDEALALEAWLNVLDESSGPIFRSIDRHGNISTAALSDKSVNLIVKKYVALIGLNPADYGAHSLRSGFATETGLQGIEEQKAMRMTGHSHQKTFRKYRRLGEVLHNEAAHVLKNVRKKRQGQVKK